MLILIFILIICSMAMIILGPFNVFSQRPKIPALSNEENAYLYYKEPEPKKRPSDILEKFSGLLRPVGRLIKQEALSMRLISAGSSMHYLVFFGVKILSLLCLPLAVWIIFRIQLNLYVLFSIAGFFMPNLWLRAQIAKRHRQFAKDLPNVIDLLNLCVSAGLDFMMAIERVIKGFRPCPLTKELDDVYHEVKLGRSRHEALRHFAKRIDMPEIYSLVYTLIQADKMGSPVSEVLKKQAEEIRIRIFMRGDVQAQKAPIKLLFPLIVFILPVVLIIVAAPIILQFTRGGFKF